jgi:hypothetical protein
MAVIPRFHWRIGIAAVLTVLALIVSLAFTVSARVSSHATGNEPLIQISSDPYTNTDSQHATQVEPDTFSFGTTVVSVFQSGRFYNGGASNIGFSTSIDSGTTWTPGFLPGTTVNATPPGIYARTSDAAVAFDAKHHTWIVSYLGLFPNGNGAQVDLLVSRSTDGGFTWGNPVAADTSGDFLDKNWIVCDNSLSSPFYGNCYQEFDDNTLGDLIQMTTSSDGGLTWGAPQGTANSDFGIGGQPLVQPNGNVVVPIIGFKNSASQPFKMISFMSTNGGASWGATTRLAEIDFHIPQGVRATIPLPSAEIDKSGKIYVVWQDCRFENGCANNDLVLSTSKNGTRWSTPVQVPIKPVGSGADFFIPGLAVDSTTSGSSAHLGLSYYFYPVANCQTASCLLTVGFISSTNGGASWSKPEQLAGPMLLKWLPLTTQGYMVGDYISTSIVSGDKDATPAFAVAQPPVGLACIIAGTVCNVATFTTPEDLEGIVGGTVTAGNNPVYAPPNRPITVSRTAY